MNCLKYLKTLVMKEEIILAVRHLKVLIEMKTPIDLSKYYLSNTLVIFNRYGQKVYEADNYMNDWDAGNIKDGIYFYILKCDGYYEDKTYTGSVTVLRSNP